jgi:hypothetical protein
LLVFGGGRHGNSDYGGKSRLLPSWKTYSEWGLGSNSGCQKTGGILEGSVWEIRPQSLIFKTLKKHI